MGQVPRGLKPLAEIVSEYVALKEANTLRLQLLAGNPALSDVFQVIETHAAACQPAPLLNPAAQVRADHNTTPNTKCFLNCLPSLELVEFAAAMT